VDEKGAGDEMDAEPEEEKGDSGESEEGGHVLESSNAVNHRG
jgi:hypothetical protein